MKYILSFCFAVIIFVGSDVRAMQPKSSTLAVAPTKTEKKLDDISRALEEIKKEIGEIKDQQAKLHEGVDKLSQEINRFKSEEEYKDYNGEAKNHKTTSSVSEDPDPFFILHVLHGIIGLSRD